MERSGTTPSMRVSRYRARNVLNGQMAGRELLALAHVDERHALVHELVDLGGVHLLISLLT